ncbi:hypothetical protein KI248_gp61 [Mycobacterium phage Phaded]|uniref:Uncharacterized protein n=1 Tax=Mycobacterium phage Phaded TaxID=2686088 RepID=A0A6B9J6Y1_9CAUD|nr:hypothetical protein KI248_gp61 [Mycobacterium phage Phaded]QGZ16891.1 hypothetical protein SEA_PHADED_38 [Mycobacterium phage Phaded]
MHESCMPLRKRKARGRKCPLTCGAGDGNRTRVASLEERGSTNRISALQTRFLTHNSCNSEVTRNPRSSQRSTALELQ